MSINNNYLEVAYLYKLFVSLCLNYELEESEAKMEITKILTAKGMKKKNLRQEYCRINFSDENSMVIISGCQEDFSKILAMNNKAERIFGYNTSELINHSLIKLQPLVYGYSHDDFILNYINSKRKINKEKHNFVWGKHKSGFVMPLIMDISPYVTFEYNLCFIAFCKRSILMEMYPLKEILDAQDVFVLLSD
jgi:PAS domain S-box-containing protein